MERRQMGIACWLLLAAALPAGAQGKLTAKAPGNLFFVGEDARFAATGTDRRVTVQVTDYAGHVVKEGEYPADNVRLSGLPQGYYEIRCAAGTGHSLPTSFVVAPRPHGESRTAIDGALAWLTPPARYGEEAERIRRAGFRWVRDRLSWGEVEPTRGHFAWGRYDRAVNAEARRGLQVVEVFHDSPKWARSDGATNRFPDDLRDVFTFARAAARHFRGRARAWEPWNEADSSLFSPDPACECAAFLKAAYLGFKAGDRSLPITQVSVAKPAGLFGEELAENGAEAFYNIANYHVYDDPDNYAARAQGQQRLRRKSGAEGRPVWVTEAGIPLPARENALADTDKRRQAEFIPKSYVELLANGADKHFFFVFPHHIEDGREFGVMDADGNPYPGYAALATLTDALGEANYRGQVHFEQPELHLYVFDNGEGDTLVAWSDLPGMRVPLAIAPSARHAIAHAMIQDVVGTPRPLFPEELSRLPRLTLSSSPIYLKLPRGALADPIVRENARGAIVSSLPALTEGRSSETPHYGLREIVLRLRPPQATPDKNAEAYRLRPHAPTKIEVEVYNFSRRAFTGEVKLTPPVGWTLDRRTFAVSALPPMGRLVETLTLAPQANAGKERQRLRAFVQTPDGEQSSPAAVALEVE